MLTIGFDSEVEVVVEGPEAYGPSSTFIAHVRESVNSSAILATLSTADSTIQLDASVLDPTPEPGFEYSTSFHLKFLGAISKDWPTSKVVVDLARTDVTPDQFMGFQLAIDFVKPVTRL